MAQNETQNPLRRREDWETPTGLYEYLDSRFSFAIDLAATGENSKAPLYISKETTDEEQIALRRMVGPRWAFTNPPYKERGSGMLLEMERIFSWDRVVALIPAGLCNVWFSPVYKLCKDVFLLGRIPFEGASAGAKFDVCLAIRDVYGGLPDDLVKFLERISRKHIPINGAVGGKEERKLLLSLCREGFDVSDSSR